MKDEKAYAIVNLSINEIDHFNCHYLAFVSKGEAKYYLEKDFKIVKVIIKPV